MTAKPGDRARGAQLLEEIVMLRYAVVFFLIAIVAAIFGFGGIAGAATDIARILFVVFLVLFIASLILGRGRGSNKVI